MAYNQLSDNIDEVYLTPKETLVKSFQQRTLDSTNLGKYPEYYNEISNSPGPDISTNAEYYAYYDFEDE